MQNTALIYLEEIDSTNRYATDKFDELADASLIVAGSQTAGRGRFNRSWVSPPNQNIYASFVVKNSPHPLHRISWIGSLAALDFLAAEFPSLPVWLKWPNDIYCGERKLAGILCEGVPGDGVIIGIGININMPPSVLDRIDLPATSVLRETGHLSELPGLRMTLHKCLIRRYVGAVANIERTYGEWKSRNLILGQQVELLAGENGQAISGTVTDIGSDGELIFDTGTETRKFFSCDVRINRESLAKMQKNGRDN